MPTYTYRPDVLGRRIEKVANGQTKRYIYDGENILLEYDGSNVLQARYTHGLGIDEPIAVTKAGSTFFYHQDGLCTVTEPSDTRLDHGVVNTTTPDSSQELTGPRTSIANLTVTVHISARLRVSFRAFLRAPLAG
jgi:hypothetical protein